MTTTHYTIAKEQRPDPVSIIRNSDGMVFDVGDTIIIFDEFGNKLEFVIGGFSYNEYDDLCWSNKEKMQYKSWIRMLDSAINKSKQNISDAISLLQNNGYEVKIKSKK